MSHEGEQPILHQIHDLVAEERRLRSTHTGVGLNAEERNRLDALERELDRCWDLLRRRRAAEEYGPEAAEAVEEPEVASLERYDPDNSLDG
jgi:hypothetical protein